MPKVAVIQLHPLPGKLEENHNNAVKYIRQAAQAGTDIAVLPEYHLGELPPPDGYDVHSLCSHWEKYLNAYRALAKECGICIVPGSFAELHNANNTEKLVNAIYFIDNHGQILGRYEKKNLWHPERPHVTAGQAPHRAFDTPFGKVGLLICWDLAFPEAFRELVSQGATMVIISSFWKYSDAGEVGMRRNPESEKVFMDAALVSRAFENTCAVVYCNVGGERSEDFLGCSQVTMPFMGCVGRIDSSGEEIKVIDVDMGLVREAEGVYKIREDMKNDGWHYACGKP